MTRLMQFNAKMRRALIGVSVLFCASTLSSAMTLPEAQRRALEIAPQVAGQGAATRAAREMAAAAGRRPDPVLKLGVENLPIDGPDRFTIGRDFMTMRRVGVMQEFTRKDKLSSRPIRARG